MRKTITSISFFFLILFTYSQNEYQLIFRQGEDTMKVYQVIDCTIPSFPGGEDEQEKFLRANLRYPTDDCIDGRVFIHFIVDEDENIQKPEVIRSLHPKFDEEALRVVKLMPR